MIENKSSEMKSVYSRTETSVSDSVLNYGPQHDHVRSLAEKVDETRAKVMDIMSYTLENFLDQEGKVNPYTYVAEIRRNGGIVGLAKELVEISSRLHLECAWLKLVDTDQY